MPEHLMESNTMRPVQLEPFDHQVGGHHSMLRYNEDTLCKPLIPREQLFYETLPEELKEFTPQYRGMIEVKLHEDSDGYIKLIGYPIQKNQNHRNSCSPTSSESDSESSGAAVSIPLSNRLEQTKSSMKLLRSGSIEVSTKTDKTYVTPDVGSGSKARNNKASLNPWSLKCHKEQVARMRQDRHGPDQSKFILLENVAAHFKHPCILDLKMGPRQHGDDATAEKRETQVKKCAATTSVSLGLRMCGMQVYQQTTGIYVTRDKFFGRTLMDDTFKDTLYQFLHNGHTLRTCVIEPIVQRLEKLYSQLLKQQTFRFYSSSLLIMYGGEEDEETISQDSSEENANGDSPTWQESSHPVIEIKMIDFAHATRKGFWDDEVVHKGPDSGYLFGLKNLIRFLKDIQDEYGNEDSS
ncbi:inositol hexakisphosphate kinase 1-like [Haliotis rubra]|uniref:inositol hexakisphosphate kinase 1-like n=1 Tax=Haliotis rubra TaxID=36100 RepID=UPI001EE5DA06|nr:inositol hexakisphosphate kinase 1-like [Haliotis rubra]XP_046544843.1 inositol hexakisphosphate kinase 1-like [Haliotis rubra]XP_046544844.1 inositol hexakisphosphate kinase 1-like [Haliotis rubra]XP_046544845.1 inositol hexakisphosphate kinase 1-like [Haliotis rubra]XP_046544846.1 inositol hexakisphosphate kinase 1-like [Haliotis rubra]